jgi:hypothetical protein
LSAREQDIKDPYEAMLDSFEKSSRGGDLPDSLVNGILSNESGGRHYDRKGRVKLGPPTRTGARAVGKWQVMPDAPGGRTRTVGGQVFDLYNEAQNDAAGRAYLSEGYRKAKGDETGASLYYFGGARALTHYQKTGRIPPGSDGYTSMRKYARNASQREQESDPYTSILVGLEKQGAPSEPNPYDTILDRLEKDASPATEARPDTPAGSQPTEAGTVRPATQEGTLPPTGPQPPPPNVEPQMGAPTGLEAKGQLAELQQRPQTGGRQVVRRLVPRATPGRESVTSTADTDVRRVTPTPDVAPGAYRTGRTGEERALESVTPSGRMTSRGGVVRVAVTPQMSAADISYAAHRDLAARHGLDPDEADAYAREVVGLLARDGFFEHGDEFVNKARAGGAADVEIADPTAITMLNRRLAERHGEKVLGASAGQGPEIPALVKGVESAFDSDTAKRFGYNGPPSGVTGVERGALSTAGLAAKAGEKAYSLLDLMTLKQWNFAGHAEDARQNAEYWSNAVADLDAAHPTDLMDKLVGEAVTLPVPVAKAKLAGALLEEAAAKMGAKATPAAVGAMLGIFDTNPNATPAEAVRHVVESGLLFKSFELTQALGRGGHVAAQGALGGAQGYLNEGTAEGAIKGAVNQAGFALADPAHTERVGDEGTFRRPLSIADGRTARLSPLDMPDVPVNEGFQSPRVVKSSQAEPDASQLAPPPKLITEAQGAQEGTHTNASAQHGQTHTRHVRR